MIKAFDEKDCKRRRNDGRDGVVNVSSRDLRQRGQYLPMPKLHEMVEKLFQSEEYSQVVTLMEYHENELNKHEDHEIQCMFYTHLVQSYVRINEHVKAAIYSKRTIPKLLISCKYQGAAQKSLQACMVFCHAEVCAKVAEFEDALHYFGVAYDLWTEISSSAPMAQASHISHIKRHQAAILTRQNSIINAKSISEHGHVTVVVRAACLRRHQEAIDLLSEAIDLDPMNESAVSTLIANTRDLGFQFGQLKHWKSAEENLKRSVEISQRNENMRGKQKSMVDVARSLMFLGKFCLEEYHQRTESFLDKHESENCLEKAERHILGAISSVRSEEVNIYLLHCSLCLDLAVQHYFLGKFNKALVFLGLHLDMHSACQNNDWKFEKVLHAKHNFLTPLLDSWQKVRDGMTQGQYLTANKIEQIIESESSLKAMFQKHLESRHM
uniref:Uncharacterized protein n=1 Tax=Chaetoceros debilis TaxID=122233 RepID=A0A7S3Q053_9STRA